MKIVVSGANGSTSEVKRFLGQAFPGVRVVCRPNARKGFDVTARIQLDPEASSGRVAECVGRNIIQAHGGLVIATTSDGSQTWRNNPSDDW